MNFNTTVAGTISPTLISGGRRLLFTESACFIESDGIELKLPSMPGEKEISFQFCFDMNVEQKKPIIKLDLIDNMTIKITLVNFNNTLGTGTTSPLEFNIGDKKHWLLIYTLGLTNQDFPANKLINMTVSMYRDGV